MSVCFAAPSPEAAPRQWLASVPRPYLALDDAMAPALTVESRPELVPTARRWSVARATALGADVDALAVVELLSSEVVGNAVRHGLPDGHVSVRVSRSGAALTVEVHDACPDLPVVREQDAGADCGRGMHLIQALATTWAVRPDPDGGKTISFEVRLAD
ncbi:ATP-binding protein [Cellulomonas bogoriensis]|uniref:Histidine kinase/HSP90-like ATPase domain-containing protein n=1 Tax=Cellulomonas bogoriensis 69B4 = DSM 16987 TaxID=1386082 RepID=A0A0A0BXJ3_9CELL|nr:ATP-binding protein [Cellulomonas bogoriensis]KGM12412.1 hypothetical protein N869_01700 [Cellulomonas bogoriensis 69B4 = DSM 16987]